MRAAHRAAGASNSVGEKESALPHLLHSLIGAPALVQRQRAVGGREAERGRQLRRTLVIASSLLILPCTIGRAGF